MIGWGRNRLVAPPGRAMRAATHSIVGKRSAFGEQNRDAADPRSAAFSFLASKWLHRRSSVALDERDRRVGDTGPRGEPAPGAQFFQMSAYDGHGSLQNDPACPTRGSSGSPAVSILARPEVGPARTEISIRLPAVSDRRCRTRTSHSRIGGHQDGRTRQASRGIRVLAEK